MLAANPIEAELLQESDVFAIRIHVERRRTRQRIADMIADSAKENRLAVQTQTHARGSQTAEPKRLLADVQAGISRVEAYFKLIKVRLPIRPRLKARCVAAPSGLLADRPAARRWRRSAWCLDQTICQRSLPDLGRSPCTSTRQFRFVASGDTYRSAIRAEPARRIATGPKIPALRPCQPRITQPRRSVRVLSTAITNSLGLPICKMRPQRHFPVCRVAQVMMHLASVHVDPGFHHHAAHLRA